jgi:hypothetical protein
MRLYWQVPDGPRKFYFEPLLIKVKCRLGRNERLPRDAFLTFHNLDNLAADFSSALTRLSREAVHYFRNGSNSKQTNHTALGIVTKYRLQRRPGSRASR